MSWLNLHPILKSKKVGERDIRLYRRCNFLKLYNKMDETKSGPYESIELRSKWKDLLLDWNEVNQLVWRLVRLKRTQSEEWNERAKIRAYEIIFKLLVKMKYLYSEYMNLVNQTHPIWQNIVINVINAYGLRKEDVYEVLPHTQISSLKLLFRQIFEPTIKVISDLEDKLLKGEVDLTRMNEFEDIMLLSVLPHFERVYKEIIRRQEVKVW